MSKPNSIWILTCDQPEPNEHDTPNNTWVFAHPAMAHEGKLICDAYCKGEHKLFRAEVITEY